MKIKLLWISTSVLIITTLVLILYCSFHVNGKQQVYVPIGSNYEELGATSIFGSVKKIGNVDVNKIGEYVINYSFLFFIKQRYVSVIDNEAPTIKLHGNNEINISLNGSYKELGYEAFDNYDGDLTDKVVVSGNVNLESPGTYEINYYVQDSSHNETTISRKINVHEKGPLSMDLASFSLDGYFEQTILKETNEVSEQYINETIFFGDSITFNFAYYENLPWKVVWARSSLTPENAYTWTIPINPHGTEMTVIDAVKKYQPKRLIVTLGANAVATMTEEYFINSYEQLIQEIKKNSPNTLIIVQSIFPVDRKWDNSSNSQKTINNTKINRLNYFLAQMCENNDVKFLNSASILKDTGGTLKQGYGYESDGIHLLPNGNEKVINYIKTHAYLEGEY